jgi:uroporphyrinogen decarboxylase
MNSLERVKLALAHKEPDRVPIDFGGWLSGISAKAYRNLAKYLGLKNEAGGYDPGEELQQRFGADFRRITPKSPAREKAVTNPDGSVTDKWGITRVYANEDDQIVDFPLKRAMTIADLDKFKWPSADPAGRYDTALEEAQAIHKRGFAVAAQPDICGVFELSCWLGGFEKSLTDMALNPDFSRALFERICQLQEKFAHNYYGTVKNNIEYVQTGDDFGTQNGPFFSNDMYRELVMPYHKRYNDAIRRGTNAMIFQHSCGSVYKLLDSMISAGVQILNPVQVSAAGMDPKRLKKEFGDRIVFHGAIDVQTILPVKKPAEVRDEVKRIIDALAPGGGYILAPSHNIQGDTPPENIVAMFEAALEFGKY